MALVSFEQRRQRERADEQADKIREDLREYDLQHSQCPVDRQRAEKEAEQKALEAHDAEQNRRTENWMNKVDYRIGQWFTFYFGCKGYGKFGIYNESMGQVIAEEKRDRQKEVKTAIEEERQSVDAKL